MNDLVVEQVTEAPFDILENIDKRSRQLKSTLPKVEKVKAQWGGIAFSINNTRFISPIGQVQEILTDPDITVVPGAKSWIKGIVNNRGVLLPVVDLSLYLGMGRIPVSRRNRVLIIRFGLLICGLQVHEVYGQRQFLYEEETPLPEDLPESLPCYVEGAYAKSGEVWLLFNMRRLAENPDFIQAAA